MTLVDEPDALAGVVDDENLADPYPYLSWVSEHFPVHQGRGGAYLVLRHADCARVMRDAVFRMPGHERIPLLYPEASRYPWFRTLLDNAPFMQNPPIHTRLRRLLNRDFTVRRVELLRDSTARLCDRLLDGIEEPLRAGESVDAHRMLSAALPMHVISNLVGFPEADRMWLFGQVPTVLQTFAPGPPRELLDKADVVCKAINDYLLDLVETRRREPKDDLASAWVRAHDDDADKFTHDELLSILWGIIAAGLATTAAAVSNGLIAIMRYPGHTWRLRGGDQDVMAFVDEVVRHDSPSMVAGLPRYPSEDVCLSGVSVPAGSEVRTMLSAANRDPRVFPDPDRFDPSRDTSRALSFGHGVHHCLGVGLARMQLATLLPAVHRRFPGLRMAEEPRWRRPLPIRTVDSLPVGI